MSWLAIGKPGETVRYQSNIILAKSMMAEGEYSLEVDDVHDVEMMFDATGALVEAPSAFATQKDALWVSAKDHRDGVASSGCMTPSGRVDTNTDSQRLINGAATAAGFAKSSGTAFSVDWTMADNSVVTMDADAIIAVGMAVVAFLDAVQKAGTAIRAQIDACTDTTGLKAIDITAGYPGNS